jgi:hypothetical protein
LFSAQAQERPVAVDFIMSDAEVLTGHAGVAEDTLARALPTAGEVHAVVDFSWAKHPND